MSHILWHISHASSFLIVTSLRAISYNHKQAINSYMRCCEPDGIKIDVYDLFIMWYLYEKSSAVGKFKEALDVFPDTLSVPLCLPRKELHGLPKQMLIEIDEDIADIEARYERFQQIAETACAIKLQFIEWRDFRLAAALIRSRWVIVTDSKFEENAPKW